MFSRSEFEKYRVIQDRLYQSDFDRMLSEIQAIQTKEAKGNE